MNDWPDMRLLREYAEHGNEEAFALLVSRHLSMVYQSAVRQTWQPELAKEISQTVFTLLARKAACVSGNTILSGWLFNTTRFVSTRAVRDEMRRQHRQAEAARMNSDSHPSGLSARADRVLPFLDEMLSRLPNVDRQAVLARYFEDKTFRQVGDGLSLTEEAAKKRVKRALEKLRRMLRARGIDITGAVLGTTFEAAKAQPLPPGLSAAAVSGAALKGAGGAIALSTLTQTTLEIMKWAKIKIAAAACVAIALGLGTATHFLKPQVQPKGATLESAVNPAEATQAAIQELASRLRGENAQLAVALAAANARKAVLVNAGRKAERAIEESKETAARNLAPTNGTPGMRDAFVSMGRLMRLSSLNATNLSASELKIARESANQEAVRLLQAAGQLDLAHLDEYSPASPQEAADLATSMLHGILDLSPEQFSQVRGALTKYEAQTVRDNPQQKLALPDPEEMGPALAQIRGLLSDQQLAVLDQVLQKVAPKATPSRSRTKPDQPPAQAQ